MCHIYLHYKLQMIGQLHIYLLLQPLWARRGVNGISGLSSVCQVLRASYPITGGVRVKFSKKPASIADSRCDWLLQLTAVRSLTANGSLQCQFCWPEADFIEPDNTG